MKDILLTVAIGVALGALIAFALCSIETGFSGVPNPSSGRDPTPRVSAVESASEDADHAAAEPLRPPVDGGRLYDIAYETDPAVIAYAESIGITPACVLALARYRINGEVDPAEACERGAGFDLAPVVDLEAEPALESYSDAALESLAATDAGAAVVLARRTEDAGAAAAYYERAVILSGKPGPLVEYLSQRRAGAILRNPDGRLDVERAALGLEVFLVLERLGNSAGPVDAYERELTEAGVDLAPIRARAERRFERMTESRLALVGRPWGTV